VASISYKSTSKDTEVSFVTGAGEAKSVTFKDGRYTTSKTDEIEALDALANLADHPVSAAANSKE
jgi:hypothetical protein